MMVIEKQQVKMNKLNALYISFTNRYLDLIKGGEFIDELSARRRDHKVWLHMITIRKMYARTLEFIYNRTYEAKRRIERARNIQQDKTYMQEQFDLFTLSLEELQRLRRANGQWFLDAGYLLEQNKIKLSANELQGALSVPIEDWKQHVIRENKRYIPAVIFASGIGDESLRDQIMAAALHEMKNNAQVKERMHRKAQQLILGLIH